MSGFDGIKGYKGFTAGSSDPSKRSDSLLKSDQPSARRTTGRLVAGGMIAFGAAACASAETPFIADGNPQQGSGAVYQPVIQDGTPMPFTPEPPFIADGNLQQDGGGVYEPVTPVDPPFIADGNPMQGGGTVYEPVIQDGTPMPFTPEPPFIADGNPIRGGQTDAGPDAGQGEALKAASRGEGFRKLFRRS